MESDDKYIIYKLDEIISYGYGIMILTIIASIMILVHIGLDFFFHVFR